jgi:hypothetical protein
MDDLLMRPEAEATQDVSAPVLPVGPERLREFDKVLRKYKAGKANLERRVVASEQWWRLRNDEQSRKEMGVGNDRDFESRSGWLHNVLVSKHADAMENYPEALVLPREPGDKQQADILTKIIPCVLEQTEFESTYSSAMWRKLKTGTAVFQCAWDADALNGLGEIRIRDVDLLSVFWEPGVMDIQDSRYFYHVELQDNDLLEEQYPQLKDKLKGDTIAITKFVYDDNVSTEGKSLVVDVYYKRQGVLHYCKYVGDQVLYSTENEEAGMGSAEPGFSQSAPGLGNLEPNFSQTPLGMGNLGPGLSQAAPGMGSLPQHRGLYDDGQFPFVFDPLFPVEGSPCGYGYVDLCKNSQVAIDLMRTAFVKNVKAGATPRYFSRSEGGVNEEELLDLTKPLVHVSGPVDEQFLRAIDSSSIPGAYINVYDSMIRELRETSGNTESANGVYGSGVTAASSIAALQEASGKTSRDASRASYRAFKKLIGMVIERIRQFYDLPRQFRITGMYGQEQFVAFDNSAMQPQPVGLGSTGMGWSEPVYDVRVEVQKRNAYTRTSQNELAIQLMQLGVFNPMMAQQSLMMLDMMDFDGKDEILQKLQPFAMAPMMPPAPVAGGGEVDPGALGQDDSEPTFLRNARERSNQAASV